MRIKTVIVSLIVIVLALFFMNACDPPEITSAKVYFQQDNIEKAEEQLDIAKEKYPDNAEVYYLLATGIYVPKGKWEKARDALQKAVEIDPSYKQKVDREQKRIWSGLHTEAANTFNEAVEAIFPEDRDSLLNIAAEKFKKALAVKNDEAPTYNGLVKSLYLLKDTVEVKKYAKMAMNNGVFDKDVVYYYTQMLWEPGKHEQALTKIDSILADHPDFTDLKKLKIQYLTEMEEYDRALEVANNLIQENPDNTDLRFVLAQIYVKTNDLKAAANEFEKVIQTNPEDKEALLRIARVYFNSKDWAKAEDYTHRYLDLAEEQEKGIGYEILWKSIYNQGRQEEALEYREKAKQYR